MNLMKWVKENKEIIGIAVILVCLLIVGTIYLQKVEYRLNELNAQIITKSDIVKPTYEELKSHTVYVTGCADSIEEQDKPSLPLGEKGMCWGGTGLIIKVTDIETYILTNNHVAGKETKNPIIFIENGNSKVQAELVKYHSYMDMAVMKIQGKLEGKIPLTKISYASITDPIYIVGHPLYNKYVWTEGVVAGYTEDLSMLLQAPCIFGNSGSGVFNSKGELVGLVYALQMYPGFLGMPMPQITHTVVVDSIFIKTFLHDLGLYND